MAMVSSAMTLFTRPRPLSNAVTLAIYGHLFRLVRENHVLGAKT